MKLRRLAVANFAAVREVTIEFGQGLNVLYGPNDLGKSTLVEAIRLALLLPHASTSSEQYVGWTGGRDPVVDLIFETEPQRIWCVRKTFGKSGSSLLQQSKNGLDFEDVERGRKVDGKLREVLCWGIPEPGGSGGTKGVPSSFLATALLSTQSDVTAMLRDSLESDPTATGKDRIAAALQAVAQDPLFVTLLKSTQARRDEAYTDKGAKKQSKGSVFKVAAERVREAREEKERLQRIVSDSEGAEKLLQGLNEKRTQRQEALAIATERTATLGRLASQAGERTAAAEQVRSAQESVRRIRGLGVDVAEAERKSSELLGAEEVARQALTVAQNGKVEADAALKSADETARAEGADSGASDTLLRQQLELRFAGAEQATRSAQQRIDDATAAQKIVDAVTDGERNFREQQRKRSIAQEASTQATEKLRIAIDELQRTDLLERGVDVRSAEKELADANIAVEKHSALQLRLAAALEERDLLAGRRRKIVVPPSNTLVPMRRLESELNAAQGALDVGFVVTINPKRTVNIGIQKDGQSAESVSIQESFEIEANANVALTVADLASIHIRGGRREAQQKVLMLEERWKLEVVPHLVAVGVTELPGLEVKVLEAQELDVDIKAKDADIESLQTQISGMVNATETQRQKTVRHENCRVALGEVAMETLSAELDRLGADPVGNLRKQRQQLSNAVESARTISAAAATAYTLADERASNLQSLLQEAIVKRDLTLISFPEGVSSALARGQSDLVLATADAETTRTELASLDQTIALRKARIDEAVAGARAQCEMANAAVEAVQARLTEAMTSRAALAGRLTELRKSRDAEDLGAAEAKLQETTARYAALPVPERTVTQDESDTARSNEAVLTLELEHIDRDIQRAHGALEQVGGAVAREKLLDATEAFELAQQQDREIEAEYEAWKLLLDQMKEADEAQASNLGLTLAPAIASRFQALTDRRYENVRLTASLATEGVVVAGAVRSSDRMSVGTREQLSTLYRLALAEYLQTVVVLDDQLVQSDESRMEWFRALLKEKSRTFQIIVFTCRPGDYLHKSSMVPKGKALSLDTDKGYIRAIDLGRALGQTPVSAAKPV